jgi:hypothetical protein
MTQSKPLSPSAQAVLDAVASSLPASWIGPEFFRYEAPKVAAALQALVNNHGVKTKGGAVILNGDDILALAAELEGPDVREVIERLTAEAKRAEKGE